MKGVGVTHSFCDILLLAIIKLLEICVESNDEESVKNRFGRSGDVVYK